MNIDIAIIFAYLILINLIGLKFSKFQNINDYFLGGRTVHWLIACFSIVATETSTLTFISIPGLSYIKGMGFIQVSFGYLVGRILVAVLLIPKYFEGRYETVYKFLQRRFGILSRRAISVVFHVTRLLADSVRLFATAIPLAVLTGWDYKTSIVLIGLATFIYTYYGGLKSVVIVDTVQLFLYIACAFLGMYLIADSMSMSSLSVLQRIPAESIQLVSSGLEGGFRSLFGSYNIISGVIGGAFLSFASHGTDHLLVQRVLSCRDEKSAQKAMIFSGVIVILQFFLFLLFGLFIKVLLSSRAFDRSDEILPYFIVNYLPYGFRGIMLAGIFAAAMSTLSSSINSLSSSTSVDILGIDEKNFSDSRKVGISRGISLVWTIVIIGISVLLQDTKNPLVEIGLSIASVTYGGMMGIFLMGRFFEGFSDRAALAGVLISIVVNVFIAFATSIFWVWYVSIGFAVSFVVGVLLNWIIIAWGK